MSRPRRSWLLLLIGLPVAIVGLVEIVVAPPFGRDWRIGWLCVLLFGGIATVGAYGVLPHRTKPTPTIDLGETVYVRTSPAKAAFIALLGFLLTAVCVLLAGVGPFLSIHGAVGVVGFLLFAPAAGFALVQVVRGSRPALEIGPMGVKVWRLGGLLVPWSKIAAIRAGPVSGQMAVCFDIPDWQEFAPVTPRWQRPAARLNAMLGYPPLAVSANGLAISNPALTTLVTAYATAAGVSVYAPSFC